MIGYDAICVFDPKIKDEKLSPILEKIQKLIKDNGGEVEKVDKWGFKRLAHPIKRAGGKVNDGYYIIVNFKSDGKAVKELQGYFRVTEDIMRFIVTKKITKALEMASGEASEEKVEIAESMLSSPEKSAE